MKINLEIPAERIANMMITAIESGDPVTTASRGGWCVEISNKCHKSFDGSLWYADPDFYEGKFEMEVVELDDERTGHETRHMVGPADMERGLVLMSTKFPRIFGQVLRNEIDAPCADIFLQCTLFGDETYC